MKKSFPLLFLSLLVVVIPFTYFAALNQQHEVRSHASANFTPTSGRPFADNSPFNDPIGTNVQLDPNSASMVSKAAASPAIADMIEFGTPIFFADASTPKYSIKCSAGYGHCHLEDQQVPIPAGAQSAPGSDGQMVVVDLSTNKTYDFWIYKNDHANTAWGDVIDITGPGYDSPENSALGAGTSRLSGIVRTYEMTSSIEHALVFSTTSCDKQMRVPATKSDGQSGGIPEGARFQLDPSINVDTIAGITPGEKVVAKAMQKYGAYAIDCGGASMALQFENPIGKTDPYAGVGFSNDYFAMSHIPWDKMRVLNAWNSYTPGVQPTTGGGGAAPTVAPTLLVPTYSCISGVPCTSPGPTQDPNITSAPITPGGGGGETNPTTSPNNPEPTTTQPCGSTNSIVTAKHHKRHKKYRRGGGGFLQQFIQFIMKFIMYLLERLGIQVPNIPTPTDPGNGNPCPQPTTAVEPTTAIIAPTTAIQPTVDPGVTVAPTQATPATGSIFLGAAVDPDSLDNATYSNALKQNKFTSLTAENAMKFAATEPTQGQFNFAGGDKMVAFAQANNMRVRGHTLVWHDTREIPAWVNGLSNADAETALKNHITTLMTRYKGKVQQWDVVNEAFDDNGMLRDSVWKQKLGATYIEKVFQWAREADPTAQLFYNDYGVEGIADRGGNKKVKSDAVYNMVKDFKARNIPIDGVGLQTHSAGDYPGTGAEIGANIARLVALGIKVEITELDVINIADQPGRYAEIGKACKDNGCTGITTWGLYDGATWLSGQNPLLLDGSYKPKPAYTSLMTAIGQ